MLTIGKKLIRDMEREARLQLRDAEIQRKIAERKERKAKETLDAIKEHGRPRVKSVTATVTDFDKKINEEISSLMKGDAVICSIKTSTSDCGGMITCTATIIYRQPRFFME